jgi:hypothetical protein
MSTGDGPPTEVLDVHIGLDFGTHSTKIVIRKEFDEHGDLLVVEPPPDNSRRFHPHKDSPYPWFAIPSVIGIESGRIVFGEAARALPDEQKHYALKATLLKGEPPLPASLDVASGGLDNEESVNLLTAAFLIWVLQRVRARLDEALGKGRWRAHINMSAPMNHFEDHNLKLRYLRVLNAAFHGVFGNEEQIVDPGWNQILLLQRIGSLLKRPIPPDGERLFDVLPETVAGMVPVCKDPRWSGGFYNVIDIGGGTTEISILFLAIDQARVIDCREDESIPVGSIDLRQFEKSTDRQRPDGKLKAALKRLWCNGYRKDKDHRLQAAKWKRTTVLMAGGGWTDATRELLNSGHPARIQFVVGPPHSIDSEFRLKFLKYAPSKEVLRVSESPGDRSIEDRDAFELLPTALGLALWPQDWPKWYRPSEYVPSEPDPQEPISDDPFHGHA